MQKGIVLYNYTSQGLKSLRQAIHINDRPGCDLYAYYFPQSAVGHHGLNEIESVSKEVLRDHFHSFRRRTELRNCRLFFGGSVTSLGMLQIIASRGAYDFLMAGFTGNQDLKQPFISTRNASNLQQVVALQWVIDPTTIESTLLISNSSHPFLDGIGTNPSLHQQDYHFYQLRSKKEEISLPNSLKADQIFLAVPIREVISKALKEGWSRIFVELDNKEDMSDRQIARMMNLAYNKGIALHITRKQQMPAWRELEIQLNKTY